MSSKSISQSWHRVSGLRPRLAAQARIHRQVHRGEVWYLLQDLGSQHFYRIGSSAHRFVGLLDGRRSVEEIWQILNRQLGDDAPTQDEVIRLLSQLHHSNVLLGNLPPDA
ncbi:MAG: PqqD family protein, partial [Acidobacteriota bacterium]